MQRRRLFSYISASLLSLQEWFALAELVEGLDQPFDLREPVFSGQVDTTHYITLLNLYNLTLESIQDILGTFESSFHVCLVFAID